MAHLASVRGDQHGALTYAERALRIYEELPFETERASAAKRVVVLQLELGKRQTAESLGLMTVASLEALGDPQGAAGILAALAKTAEADSDFGAAINHWEHLARLADQAHEASVFTDTILELGFCYFRLRQPEKAIEYAQQTVRLGKEHSNFDAISGGFRLEGHAKLSMVDWHGARTAFESAFAVARESGSAHEQALALIDALSVQQLLGFALDVDKDFPRGIEFLNRGASPWLAFHLLLQRGRIADADGDFAKAQNMMLEAVATARKMGSLQDLRLALIGLATVHRSLKNHVAAVNILREVVDVSERIRTAQGKDLNKVSLGQCFRMEYSFLQEALAELNKPGEVMEIAERGRARAFADLLASSLGGVQSTAVPITQVEIQAFVNETQNTVVEYSQILKIENKPPFNEMERDIFACVARPGRAIELCRIPLSRIELPVEGTAGASSEHEVDPDLDVRKLTSPNSRPHRIRDLETFAGVLIDPIEELLPSDPTQTLLFVPSEWFLTIPFAALPHPEGGRVVDHHVVMVAPSIQVLTQVQKRVRMQPPRSRTALVIGNPDNSLKHAEAEAREIAGMMPSKLLLGSEATKAQMLDEMPRHKVLHFATHGSVTPTSGAEIPGAILLAPAAESDVWLRADEIMGLSLNADLVVLSACSTALGKETADGVIGLSRAFLGAGAASVLLALWDVPDFSTRVLMSQFYREYLQHGDKGQALRQGMFAAMKVDSDPVSWAGFVLMGERFSRSLFRPDTEQ